MRWRGSLAGFLGNSGPSIFVGGFVIAIVSIYIMLRICAIRLSIDGLLGAHSSSHSPCRSVPACQGVEPRPKKGGIRRGASTTTSQASTPARATIRLYRKSAHVLGTRRRTSIVLASGVEAGTTRTPRSRNGTNTSNVYGNDINHKEASPTTGGRPRSARTVIITNRSPCLIGCLKMPTVTLPARRTCRRLSKPIKSRHVLHRNELCSGLGHLLHRFRHGGVLVKHIKNVAPKHHNVTPPAHRPQVIQGILQGRPPRRCQLRPALTTDPDAWWKSIEHHHVVGPGSPAVRP